LIRCAILHATTLPSPEGQGVAPDSFLNPREAALLGPRAVPKRRADFARGRWIAKQLIRHLRPDTNVRTLSILPDRNGVPWIHDDGSGPWPISLSISHCRDYAAAAIAELPSRVGVDVETTLAQPGMIADNYFTPSEQDLVRNSGDAANQATAIWTLKEAGLKVLGVGLRAPSTSVVVQGLGGLVGSTGWIRTALSASGGTELRAWYRPVRGGVVALAERPSNDIEPPSPVWFG
jgi:4'-phosphopantetheinyl transferase EntD